MSGPPTPSVRKGGTNPNKPGDYCEPSEKHKPEGTRTRGGKKQQNKISVLTLNINCAKIHRNLFKLQEDIAWLVKEERSDIIILTECDFPSVEIAGDFKLDGFKTIVPKDTGHMQKIRIIALVRNEIKHEQLDLESDYPFVALQVKNTMMLLNLTSKYAETIIRSSFDIAFLISTVHTSRHE